MSFEEEIINNYIDSSIDRDIIKNISYILIMLKKDEVSLYPVVKLFIQSYSYLEKEHQDNLLRIIVEKITDIDDLSYVIESMNDYDISIDNPILLEKISSFKKIKKSKKHILNKAKSKKPSDIYLAVVNNYFDYEVVNEALNNKNIDEDTLSFILNTISDLSLIEKAINHPNLSLTLTLCFMSSLGHTDAFEFIVKKVNRHKSIKILQ